jgi:O-antigen ligase
MYSYHIFEKSIEIGQFSTFSRGLYSGFFSNINITSFSIVLKLPFIFFKLLEKINLLKYLKYFLILTLSLLAIIILNSRGSYLALFTIIILFLILNVKNFKQTWRPLFSILIAFGISVLFSFKFSSNNVVQRLSSINIENTTNDSSIKQRLYYYENALTSILKDPPRNRTWKLETIRPLNMQGKFVEGFTSPLSCT